ncbi:MAG TPA: TonB-dependent receptor [Candidatus Acidoferrales bacterium]|nr:TonB-dependent receptor [Candidatus Acidoferrales bacterium]
MNRRLWRIGVLGLLLGVAASPPLWSQTISGIIAGTVVDPQGAVLPAVSITVTNPATGRTYVASTNDAGYYRIPEIAPGVFEVTAELGGFQSEKHTNVRVNVNRVTVEDFTLQIPPQVEVVEVTSQAPMTDTTGATLSTYFPERQLTDLPILTRDINNLALLAPGVASVRTFSFASTLVPFAVNGSRGRENNFIIDSVDNNEPLFGGAAAQFTNTDIFAEYTILTHSMKAEFGRNSGGTVNVITKSGSNFHHGSLFWFGQHDEFNARSRVEKEAFLGDPSTFYENVLGFTLGGPLKKDRAFYMISYQWDRSRTNLSNAYPVVATLPTTNGLATLATFPQSAAIQAMLASPTIANIPGTPATCFNAVPAEDPNGSTTNPCFPPITEFITGVEFGTFQVPNANLFDVRDHQASGRFDVRMSNTDDLYIRYLFDDLKTPRAVLAPAGETAFGDLGLMPEYRYLLLQRTQSALINERHYFVNALNEFRFSFTRIAQQIGPFGVPDSIREGRAAATVIDNFGGFGAFSGLFPAAGVRFTLGRDTRPSDTASNIFGAQDNFSFNRGRHSFKLGFNLVRTDSDIRNIPSDLGQYFYGEASALAFPGFGFFTIEDLWAPNTPSFSLAVIQRIPNVLTDSSGNIIGQGPESLGLQAWDHFYFFQDDFRVSSNFTLSYGIRYENFGQPINRIRKLNPAGPSVEKDNNNFAPRIGFAWSPWSGGVLRGGYGIMYNPMPLNIPLLIWQSGPISPFFQTDSVGFLSFWQPSGFFPEQPLTINDVNVLVADCSNYFFRSQTPTNSNPNMDPVPFPTAGTPLINCSNQDTVDPKLVNPYVQHFSFSWQQELGANALLEIGWVHTKGTKLFQRVDENPYCFEGDDDCLQGGRGGSAEFCTADPTNFFCQFPRLSFRTDGSRGAVTRVTNSGRSTYHALQVSLTKRTSRTRVGDFSMTAAYTWSHLIDSASEIFGPGVRFIQPNPIDALFNALFGFEAVEAITPLAQNHANLAADKGNSAFDRRHRLALSYLWEIAPKKGFWAGGWQFSGIVSLQSGQFFTPLNGFGACTDYNGDGRFAGDRPSVGNPNAPDGSIALLADVGCLNPTLGYVDASGDPIDPATARFVQVPIGVLPSGSDCPVTVPDCDKFSDGTTTFTAGDAGRNILEGPGLVNFDFAFYKNFRWGEGRMLQFRWEIYDLFNHPNLGNPIGNVFAADAQPSPAFAFLPSTTPARVTGVIPENLISATDRVTLESTFLSRRFMNTSARRMQFGVKIIF